MLILYTDESFQDLFLNMHCIHNNGNNYQDCRLCKSRSLHNDKSICLYHYHRNYILHSSNGQIVAGILNINLISVGLISNFYIEHSVRHVCLFNGLSLHLMHHRITRYHDKTCKDKLYCSMGQLNRSLFDSEYNLPF